MTGRLVLMCAVLLPILAQATVIGAEDIALLRAGVVKITAKPPGGSPQVGTGFIVRINRDRESVYIITAAHVVSGDPRPQVEFFPKRNVPVPAEVLGAEGSDEVRGLAMLMVRGNANIPSDIAALQLASDIHLGEDIILIGFPRGAGPSAIIRGNVSSREGHDIYFSPTVGEGNSGGPIIQNGKVVGLVGAGNQSMGQGVTARSIEDYTEGFGLPAQGSTSDSKTEIQEAVNITQPPPRLLENLSSDILSVISNIRIFFGVKNSDKVTSSFCGRLRVATVCRFCLDLNVMLARLNKCLSNTCNHSWKLL